MKSISIVALFVCVMAVSGFAQDTSVNINTLEAQKLSTVPTIDGDLSDPAWANIPEIVVNGSGDDSAPSEAGDLDITMKVAWDDETNALYFAFNVKDDYFLNLLGIGSSQGGSGWQNERLELITNGANTGDPSHGENSEFHTQYIFDIPNTIDDAPNGLANIPFSTEFISVPVFEGIDGSIQASELPYNLSDDYIESAAMIRVTDPGADGWLEVPVEWNWEIKVVIFEEMHSNSVVGVDTSDPAMVAEGYKEFFEEGMNVVKDLALNDVIGISPQQNDADEFGGGREHQVNTTNRDGNWDSSEFLTGLILVEGTTGIQNWELVD